MKQQFILPTLIDRQHLVERIAHVLVALPHDVAWRLELHEHKPTRSSQQNRYLWGVCYKTICEHLSGWDADDVHEYMLGEHFGWETVEGLGKKRIRPLRRSSRLTTEEFADYIDFVQRRAADHGIYIADPSVARTEAA